MTGRAAMRLPGWALWAALSVSAPAAFAAEPANARPQLDAAAAARHQVADYLAQGPSPWQPAEVDAARWRPDFIVAPDGSGTHHTVQAAVDAVPARTDAGTPRTWVIRIRPGTYRGPLCVQDKAPLRLVGEPGDARAVTLVDGRYNASPKPAGTAPHPCLPPSPAERHGTSGSATAVVASPDVLLAHLSIANDATEPGRPALGEGAQAVALLTLADRVQLEDVRLSSHQDTFYVRRPTPTAPARVYVRGSTIAGDVDFVFGNATLVIDDSTLVSRGDRPRAATGDGPGGAPSPRGIVLAPSTPADARLGFLVLRSRFVAGDDLPEGSVSLGRAWDEGVAPGTWRAGVSPNGQAVVRDSALGPHIGGWSASTSRRPFVAAGAASDPADAGRANRLAEHANTRLPQDIARETLPPGDGWAGVGPGTRGGADAAPQDVHRVRTRAELVAALQPHERPRIVKVLGRIDLSTADDGRPLGADDFRDPAFSWPAFAAAYDPATWGRRPPEGPLEEARRASARAQAAQVQIAVPSRTTLIGWGPDAALVNGGLALVKVQDVIIRNLLIRDAYDHFPAWDPKDNGHGEWNSEYDNITLRQAERVWVDHCTLDDGDRPDAAEPSLLGRRLQRHDGLLDITRASSHVTVSWTHFRHHDKTSLVGGSDRHSEDEGRLKVSYHHNLWEQTKERSPRVRYGQVHLTNNLYLVRDGGSFGYSIGLGHRSAVISEHNAWEIPPGLPSGRLIRSYGSEVFEDRGSTVNGQPVDWPAALAATQPSVKLQTTAGWQPPPGPAPDPTHAVAARVRAGAGAGRLWTGP
jgi:pectate lyase/pectin methylesterase-like acyl-CoA thioesterase